MPSSERTSSLIRRLHEASDGEIVGLADAAGIVYADVQAARLALVDRAEAADLARRAQRSPVSGERPGQPLSAKVTKEGNDAKRAKLAADQADDERS